MKAQSYLGEWHFHPGAAPEPSPEGEEQLRQIAVSSEYHCPEPVLMLVGGNLGIGYSMRAFVFPKGQEACEMVGSGEMSMAPS